jgi:type IV pilus assembly protein PilV
MAATRTGRARQRGFNLLEILMTLFVITVGLLGLVGIQVFAQRAEQESYQRAQAIVLMSDIVDRINTNRKGAVCYRITASTGTPYLGTEDSDKYDPGSFACPALATMPEAVERAELDVNQIDALVLGSAEQISGTAVGAMLGARACIGFDTNTQAYTVAVAWQGMSRTFSPASWDPTTTPAIARNCAKDKYGSGADDAQRRVVWTTFIVASLT